MTKAKSPRHTESGGNRTVANFVRRRFAIDLRTLAVARITFATLLFIDALMRFGDARAHYSDEGNYPFAALKEEWGGSLNWMATPFALDGSVAWAQFLLLFTAAAAVLLGVGWQSRFAMFLCWALLVGIHNRNAIILHGGDQMMRIFAFWMMFLPVGSRWSVDAACAKLRAYGKPVPESTVSVGTAALMVQGAIVYFTTAALKTGKEWWTEGTALWYALQIDQFTTSFGQWVRALPIPLLKVLTWSTMAVEILGPVAAIFGNARTRLLVFAGLVVFHVVMITGMMDVGPISFISLLWWIPYLPGTLWDHIGYRFRNTPLKLVFDKVFAPLVRAHDTRVRKWVEKRKPLPEIDPSVPMQVMAALILLFVIQWNFNSARGKPNRGQKFANAIRQDQYWGMFAPRPLVEDGWFVVVARLSDGSLVDLFRDGKPADFAKPAYIPAGYRNARWGKHWMNLWEARYAPYRRYMAAWMAREWNRTHPDHKIEIMTIWFCLELSPKPGEPNPTPRPVALWSQTASGLPTAPIAPKLP